MRPHGLGIHISVQDRSAAMPVLREQTWLATSGLGLRVVEGIAADWGVETTPDGKLVWAVLRP
jgi:hypothetical protein